MKNLTTMASTARKSAKTIAMQIWDKAPKSVKRSTECAIIVSMAANIVAAPTVDDGGGKAAVQDMAHELCYTWDPFDGLLA